MIFFNKKNKKGHVSLLPHTRTEVYGLDPSSTQMIGWEIKKLNIDRQWTYSEGRGVVVAVIDTGCDLQHVDIKNNLLKGINLLDNSKDPQDDNGHGSHVCGTIAAENNGLGMVGVAPQVKILPVKALNSKGDGSLQDVINGIIWSADAGADFITMSLGTSNTSDGLEKAIAYASLKGSVVFAAAGNSGEKTEILYPARYKNVISIGAIDEHLNRTSFTCSGEDLDFLSPGHNVFSIAPNNGYAIMSGTSMSNPFAVGCACLLLSHNRQHKRFSLRSAQDYIDVLSKVCIDIPEEKYRSRKYQGNGIIKLDFTKLL